MSVYQKMIANFCEREAMNDQISSQYGMNGQGVPTNIAPIGQQYQQQPQYPQQPPTPEQPKGTSGLAIAGLILGILAIITSFIPIVNNGSFLLALIGIILAIIGLRQTKKGTKTGGGLAIAGIVLNALSIVIVLATQSFYGAVIDEAVNNTATVVSSSSTATSSNASTPASSSSSSSSAATASTAQETQDLPLGTSVDVGDGLQVTVNSVTPGLVNFDGSEIVEVSVTYQNNSSSTESFNVYDWKAENAQGVQTSSAYYSKAENQLNSGTLAAGGTVTGNIYFDPDVVKVLYLDNMFLNDKYVSWLA